MYTEYLNLRFNKFQVCSIKNEKSFTKIRIFELIIYSDSLLFFTKYLKKNTTKHLFKIPFKNTYIENNTNLFKLLVANIYLKFVFEMGLIFDFFYAFKKMRYILFGRNQMNLKLQGIIFDKFKKRKIY